MQRVALSFTVKPGSHGRQLVWLSSAKPWVHSVHSVCPPKLMLLPSHGTQAVAPAVVWWPGPQTSHSARPASSVYVPPAQGMHSVPPVLLLVPAGH